MTDSLTPSHWRHVRIVPQDDSGEVFRLVTFHCNNPFTESMLKALRLDLSVQDLDLLSCIENGEKIELALSGG